MSTESRPRQKGVEENSVQFSFVAQFPKNDRSVHQNLLFPICFWCFAQFTNSKPNLLLHHHLREGEGEIQVSFVLILMAFPSVNRCLKIASSELYVIRAMYVELVRGRMFILKSAHKTRNYSWRSNSFYQNIQKKQEIEQEKVAYTLLHAYIWNQFLLR